VILFRCFRCEGYWNVIVVGNWSSNGLNVCALVSSVKLPSRRSVLFAIIGYWKDLIWNLNLFDFLLRLVVLKRPGFQSQKYGMPICTNIIKFYGVFFWIPTQHLTWKALHTKRGKRHFYFWNFSKYQTWKEKVVERWHIIYPSHKQEGNTSPVSPTKLRPCLYVITRTTKSK